MWRFFGKPKSEEEQKMKESFVIATHWDEEKKAQVKYIAGEFNNFMNANIFKNAYNEHYSTDAVIVDDFTIINH